MIISASDQNNLLLTIGYFALTERLVEALAEAQIALILSTIQELLDLPGASSGGWHGRTTFSHSSRRSCRCSSFAGSSAEESSHSVTNGMAHGRPNGNAASSGSHLAHEGWLLRLGHHGRRWWSMGRYLRRRWGSPGRWGCGSGAEMQSAVLKNL